MDKIRVTGYMAVGDIEEELVDLDHPTGLSEKGLEFYSEELAMEELTFTLERG